MSIFSTAAYAQDGGIGGSAGGFGFILMMVVIFVIFYLLTVLPQKKREKAHKKMVEALKKGDKVLTIAGIYGIVVSVEPEKGIVTLKISDNAKVDFTKSSIQAKVS
jgi:preprotein translocase subunit YajC